MKYSRTALAATLLAFASCAGTTEPPNTSAVDVFSEAGAVTLINRSDRPIFYVVYERGYSARILWGACVDPLRCPWIGPGDRVVVPHSEIGGYVPGKAEAIAYWWTGPPAPAPHEIHGTVVRLIQP